MFLIVDSKRFQPDLSVIRARELNFVLRSENFVHCDGQLRASHLILSCVSSYTSYQDSLGALTVGSPLLSYLGVWLPEFLPHRLTSGEARHQGPRIVRESLLESVCDDSGDMVFHGRVVHIPVEALTVDALVPTNPTTWMVQWCNMALERWFLGAQLVGGHVAPQLTPQQANPPLAPCQRRKRKRVAYDPTTEFGTLPADQPSTTTMGAAVIP